MWQTVIDQGAMQFAHSIGVLNAYIEAEVGPALNKADNLNSSCMYLQQDCA